MHKETITGKRMKVKNGLRKRMGWRTRHLWGENLQG